MAGQDTRKFLQRLAEDDAFRAEVERDPVAALKAHGIPVDAAKIPRGGVSLPSKESLRENLDQHAKDLDDTSGIVIFKI